MKIQEVPQWIRDLKWHIPHAFAHLSYRAARRSYADANHLASEMNPGSIQKLAVAEQNVLKKYRTLQWSGNRMPARLRHEHKKPFHSR